MLERLFHLHENGTTVRREAAGGVTTFLTLSYILFVQPVVMAAAGMDHGSVFTAVVLGSALATFYMAFIANYPVAIAPAMGHNFFFTYTVVLGMGTPWPVALGAIAIAGTAFVVLSRWGFRERIITIVPDPIKHAIAVGIGLLICMVGLQWGGIVVARPGTLLGFGDLHSPPVLVTLLGLLVMGVLTVRRVRGAILFGILASTAAAAAFGLAKFQGVAALPPSIAPTLFKLDLGGAFQVKYLEVIFIFFFLALFDTIGTLIGVAHQAGLMRDGKLPRAEKALLADALGTVTGAALGTSTLTSYVESAAGVAEGARTGLANCFTAACFLLSLFFFPVVSMVGAGVPAGEAVLHPTVAAALILVGSLMFQLTRGIDWSDPALALPAFLAIAVMPVTLSITEGIAFAFIAHSLLRLAQGRVREAHWLFHLFSLLFLARYAFIAF
jgi:AGZA family xanthine/uracil permease-like MFS transporter